MHTMWSPENAGLMWAVTFSLAAVLFGFWIFLQWRIFAKAGYPGALALLNLAIFVPVVGALIVVGLTTWFAFAEWPALKKSG